MRVLLVNYEYPGVSENCGGGGRVTQLLREGLEERGHDVRVLTDGGDEDSDPNLRGPSQGHYSTFPVRSRKHLGNLSEWADVVNGHFSLPSSLLVPAIGDDTPFVCSVMGADVHDPTRYQRIRPLADIANRYVLTRADAVVAPSRDMQRRVHQKFAKNCRTIHYGVPEEDSWRHRELHDPLRVLTVCRLVERKNFATAASSIATFSSETGIHVDWRVVGDGPLRESIEADPRINYRGYVDDLDSEYEWADVFYLPSKHEAFGMVYLEALGHGLPVVSSNCGGQIDIVRSQVGAVAPPNQPDSIASALKTVVEDYERRQDNTRGYVGDYFSQGQMVDKYAELYQEVTA